MEFVVVYSPEMKESNLAVCRRLYGFEKALKELGIEYKEPEILEFDEELLYQIHSREMIDKSKKFFAFKATFKSAWCVYTAVKLLDEYDLAIVATAGTGHNAMRDRFRGYSFINDVNLAISIMKDSMPRIAVIDTDIHHGDGVFEYAAYNDNISIFCFCNREESHESKICRHVSKLEDEIDSVFEDAGSHDALIWYLGQDAFEELHEQSFDEKCLERIARKIRELGTKTRIKTLIILSGGVDSEVTERISKKIFSVLI
ncbi:hypothetical protein Asulf_00164 [Archaeoglobus sulfaticallidus PM70-1]|uniref:Histone deacetylase domain-containing protein n=1 Tax=Archaeoglobus sulfaticallidus PM70-1 TaxID=387631 RepID=N0B9B0_9EURY|nr:hypothetical protein [Archaeoglobus sulfaticallidus]AGK60199.1 hypothetical protein Asulf_00164 [Archaeoglobus sulfaticallidus PM70-1]